MILASTIIQPIRKILLDGASFPDDPAAASEQLADLPAWRTSGASNKVAVYISAVDDDGVRVLGVTATVGGYFFTAPELFGLPTVDDGGSLLWHDAKTVVGVVLDEPLVFDGSQHEHMGVRLSSIANIGAATKLCISVQEMPR